MFHRIVVVFLPTRLTLRPETGLGQSLLRRVIHFNSTSASAGGQNGSGIDFGSIFFLVL